jgi:hypothetical protein
MNDSMSFPTPAVAKRRRHAATRSIHRLDTLESRLQFCALHTLGQEPLELRPDLVPRSASDTASTARKDNTAAKATAAARAGSASGDVGEPADIVWVNRATTTAAGPDDTDLFGARFGASALAARVVVDAVILATERMIGSFNYGAPGQTYSLTVTMGAANSGFGAGAGLDASFGGKPQAGSIELGAGNGSTSGNGWFLDPTPNESSEFQGTVNNAFAGNATPSGPASGKFDFYTIVALEITHCMGLFGNALPGWATHTFDTAISDTAEGGGVGKLWTFNGPSIKHLLTSNNAGQGGQDFGQAIHSAGPITVNIGGEIYNGAQDQGNAVYEQSRRYLVSNVFALMFKDAYDYSTVNPATFGTFYSLLNTTTKRVLVRGGSANSADTISITRSGNTIAVSVDVGADILGTGALPGPGNLPAFVTYYDVSEVSSIAIESGDLNDTVTIDPAIGVSVSVDTGSGTDTLALTGSGGDDTFTFGSTNSVALANGATTTFGSLTNVESLALNGSGGNDSLNFTGQSFSEVLTINADTFSGLLGGTYSSFEAFGVNMGGGADTLTINAPTGDTVVNAGGGAGDLIDVRETAPGKVVRSITTLNTDTLKIQLNFGGEGIVVFDVRDPTTVGTLQVVQGSSIIGDGDLTIANYFFITGDTTVGGSGRVLMPNKPSLFKAGGLGVTHFNRRLIGQASVEIDSGELRLGPGLSANGPALQMSSLSFAATVQPSKLDLADNTATIDYTGTSPVAAIRSSLAAGYAGGAWTGNGIASSTAAATTGRAIGYGEATDLFSTFPATFAGTAIDDTAIVLKYGLAADADLNGTVEFADLVRLSQNYNLMDQTFARGDFDYDGEVGFGDLVILAQQYGQTLVPGAATITATPASTTGRKTRKIATGGISLLA